MHFYRHFYRVSRVPTLNRGGHHKSISSAAVAAWHLVDSSGITLGAPAVFGHLAGSVSPFRLLLAKLLVWAASGVPAGYPSAI